MSHVNKQKDDMLFFNVIWNTKKTTILEYTYMCVMCIHVWAWVWCIYTYVWYAYIYVCGMYTHVWCVYTCIVWCVYMMCAVCIHMWCVSTYVCIWRIYIYKCVYAFISPFQEIWCACSGYIVYLLPRKKHLHDLVINQPFPRLCQVKRFTFWFSYSFRVSYEQGPCDPESFGTFYLLSFLLLCEFHKLHPAVTSPGFLARGHI